MKGHGIGIKPLVPAVISVFTGSQWREKLTNRGYQVILDNNIIPIGKIGDCERQIGKVAATCKILAFSCISLDGRLLRLVRKGCVGKKLLVMLMIQFLALRMHYPFVK